MNPSFREILDLLSKHRVEFVVVGGVAAVIHGAPVTTFDLDALVQVSDENADRLIAAFSDLDARFREHSPTMRPSREDILAGGHLLLITNAGPLDILGFIGDQKRFEDLIDETSEIEFKSGRFRVLNLEELIRQKKLTNRTKDRAVIELLEEVLRRKNAHG